MLNKNIRWLIVLQTYNSSQAEKVLEHVQ